MPTDDRPLDDLSQGEINELSDEELMGRIEIEKSDRVKAQEYHQERSREAQTADESFRSTKVTDKYETWRAAPNKRDFEGVDTIPESRKRERVDRALQTAKDAGLVSEFREVESKDEMPGETKGTERGVYSPGQNKIGVKKRLDEDQRNFTLAHEVGHAVDYGEWHSAAESMKGLGLGELEPQTVSERSTDEIGGPISDPDEATEELMDLSEGARGPISPLNRDYREKPTELFADFFAEAVRMPRNTKAKTQKSREAVGKTLADPIPELEPAKEVLESELPDNFFPEI